MRCETCSSITGFKYRGRVLCSVCINKGIQEDYARYQREIDQRPRTQPVSECEICGRVAATKVGLSSLCQACAQTVDACDHANVETTETLEDNYLVTRHLCCECGLRFQSD